jgi:hypothetical protein
VRINMIDFTSIVVTYVDASLVSTGRLSRLS